MNKQKAWAIIFKDGFIYEVILSEKTANSVAKNSAEFKILQAGHSAKIIPINITYEI